MLYAFSATHEWEALFLLIGQANVTHQNGFLPLAPSRQMMNSRRNIFTFGLHFVHGGEREHPTSLSGTVEHNQPLLCFVIQEGIQVGACLRIPYLNNQETSAIQSLKLLSFF